MFNSLRDHIGLKEHVGRAFTSISLRFIAQNEQSFLHHYKAVFQCMCTARSFSNSFQLYKCRGGGIISLNSNVTFARNCWLYFSLHTYKLSGYKNYRQRNPFFFSIGSSLQRKIDSLLIYSINDIWMSSKIRATFPRRTKL